MPGIGHGRPPVLGHAPARTFAVAHEQVVKAGLHDVVRGARHTKIGAQRGPAQVMAPVRASTAHWKAVKSLMPTNRMPPSMARATAA